MCPKCGYGNINELSLCVVMHRVTEWDPSGSSKEFGEPEIDWESEMPYDSLGGPLDREPTATFEWPPMRRTIQKAKAGRSSSTNSLTSPRFSFALLDAEAFAAVYY